MHCWLGIALGLTAALVVEPVLAQAPSSNASKPTTHRRTQVAQAAPVPQPTPLTPTPVLSAPAPQQGLPRTLAEALAATYANQPQLQAARAQLRSVDEGVPQALAGWRPTVVVAGSGGYSGGTTSQLSFGTSVTSPADRQIGTAQATITQPLYSGGKTQANVNQAKNKVMAQRATLINQEQTSFTNAVNAYVNVIQNQQLLALNINNEQVLIKQLQATNDRFRVGEITRTDVAQAEAALAGATSQRQTAEGNLQTARGVFQQVIGYYPPADLIEPQPLALPVKNQEEARRIAANNNPQVLSALFNDAAAKDAVDVAFAQLLPQVSVQAQAFDLVNQQLRASQSKGYQAVLTVSVPVYQGGSEYAAVRQAKQTVQQTTRLVDDARRTAIQNAVQAWETLVAAKASADSQRQAIRANEIALEGVEREAIVGSRTTLDVLNAQQALLNSRTTLVQNLAQVVIASYQVASAIGRLTARDLHLPVPLYDETAYYNAVKDKWVGLGDYATDQPGR